MTYTLTNYWKIYLQRDAARFWALNFFIPRY
jgi:hypothetical protein